MTIIHETKEETSFQKAYKESLSSEVNKGGEGSGGAREGAGRPAGSGKVELTGSELHSLISEHVDSAINRTKGKVSDMKRKELIWSARSNYLDSTRAGMSHEEAINEVKNDVSEKLSHSWNRT